MKWNPRPTEEAVREFRAHNSFLDALAEGLLRLLRKAGRFIYWR